MQASVIIPHFNDVIRLRKCLAALVGQVTGEDVEIIVGDNASTQDISGIQAEFPAVIFVTEPQPGAAAARNCAVAASSGEWLFFTDADCVPSDTWIAVARDVCAENTCVGGTVSVFDETPPPRSGAEAFENVFAFNQKAYIEKTHYSVTANMVVSRAMFDAVGPFDGSQSEDLEWGQRAYGMGYAIEYAPHLVVGHPTRQDWPALKKKWRRTTREMFANHGTGPKQRATWGLRGLVVLASILPHSVKVMRHPDLSARDKCAAMCTLIRLRGYRFALAMVQALIGQKPINN